MFTRFSTSFAAILFAVGFSAAAASANGTWTIQYKIFPNGSQGVLPSPLTTSGSVTTTAKRHYLGSDGVTYDFLFWNVNGATELSNTPERKLSEPSPSGANVATGWYLATGGGGKCAPTCSVATWAFSENSNSVIANTTPIASASPSAMWTSPSTSVSTETGGPKVTITARTSLGGSSPKFSPLFQRWQELPRSNIKGDSFSVNAGTTAEAIAFYRQLAAPPINPCLGKKTPCFPQ